MSQEATRRALQGMGIVVAIVTAIVVYLVIVEQDDRSKLAGTTVAGPCRAAFAEAQGNGATNHEATIAATRNEECQKQSTLLFETCVRQELHPACQLAHEALQNSRHQARTNDGSNQAAPTGGGASDTPPASSPPSPSPPGGGPSPTPDPPGNPEPPTNPPPPDNQGPIGDVLDDVCQITTPLGICLN